MKVYEVLYEEENKPAELVAPKLIQVLRTLIAQADQRGTAVYLHFWHYPDARCRLLYQRFC